MKYPKFALFFIVTASAAGCTSKDDAPASDVPSPASADAKREKVERESTEAAQALQEYTYARKEEFVAQMKESLNNAQRDVDRLAAEVEASTEAEKADAQARLAKARESWERAKVRLTEVENATESSWAEVKASFKAAHDEVKAAVRGES